MQQKSEKQNLLTVRKPDAMVASVLMGYAVKIINYRWEQSEKFVEICITLTRVHQAPTENVQAPFTVRSFDLLANNLNGKTYPTTGNNLLKPISMEAVQK